MKRLYDFSKQNVIITGAAGGIGLEIGRSFLEAGARVAFLDISRELLEAAAEDLSAYKEQAWMLECDITDKEILHKTIKLVLGSWKTVHILINNAGVIIRTSLDETTDEMLYKELAIDFIAPYHVANLVLPSMIEAGGGKIINMCSIMSEYVRENTAGYASCKGALKMLTRGMACDWGKYNIQCNGVAPGYIETEQTAPIRENDPEFYEFIKKRTIAKRWGTAKDISGIVLFLASDDAGYITGQIITVDGGMSIYIGEK